MQRLLLFHERNDSIKTVIREWQWEKGEGSALLLLVLSVTRLRAFTAYLFLNKSNGTIFKWHFKINVFCEAVTLLHFCSVPHIHWCHLSALVRYSIFPFQLRSPLHIICFVHLRFRIMFEWGQYCVLNPVSWGILHVTVCNVRIFACFSPNKIQSWPTNGGILALPLIHRFGNALKNTLKWFVVSAGIVTYDTSKELIIWNLTSLHHHRTLHI